MSERFIADAIQAQIRLEIENTIRDMSDEFEKDLKRRLRAKVGSIVASVFSEFEMSRQGQNIMIKVKFDGGSSAKAEGGKE